MISLFQEVDGIENFSIAFRVKDMKLKPVRIKIGSPYIPLTIRSSCSILCTRGLGVPMI